MYTWYASEPGVTLVNLTKIVLAKLIVITWLAAGTLVANVPPVPVLKVIAPEVLQPLINSKVIKSPTLAPALAPLTPATILTAVSRVAVTAPALELTITPASILAIV